MSKPIVYQQDGEVVEVTSPRVARMIRNYRVQNRLLARQGRLDTQLAQLGSQATQILASFRGGDLTTWQGYLNSAFADIASFLTPKHYFFPAKTE